MKRRDLFRIIDNIPLKDEDFLLRLQPQNSSLADLMPGQFVQVLVPNASNTFLRRPISICEVDAGNNQLLLYIKKAGKGTRKLSLCKQGETLDLILPLGKGFDYSQSRHPLLMGGGVGIAPMVYLAKKITEKGIQPTVLLAGKTAASLTIRSLFDQEKTRLFLCTDDGSLGEKGLITQHSLFRQLSDFDGGFCCGPTPMMKAVAKQLEENRIPCQVSLENSMACGLGACLCCVTPTKEHGNQCVCTEGPVFDSRELAW